MGESKDITVPVSELICYIEYLLHFILSGVGYACLHKKQPSVLRLLVVVLPIFRKFCSRADRVLKFGSLKLTGCLSIYA